MDTGALFDSFVTASTFKNIQQTFLQLCTALDIDPCDACNVYPRLRKQTSNDWKAAKLWKLLDKRFDQAEYRRQKACERLNTLVIGAGPCGLRAAIECALLGSRVVLIEQRDKFSRNNVLHLWEFVIHDLKALGAKIFYPKFCTGSIEHISIRQLQCILLKVSLCFGVQVHEGISFKELIFPHESNGKVSGFRASLDPAGHILSEFEIDVLIGADGKRNTVPGFQRDEMRGKLAIAITANFVNGKTAAEERVPEISGVSYIFNQTFFKEMYSETGVDLENIVYYKDETHYFVMCAKKQSLLEKGVIKRDFDDAPTLLDNDNVDREELCRYAQAAAEFSTNGKLPALDFAKNHRGQEDIAMFDFTSLYSSKCSVRLVERKDKKLLMGIVGDSLHEPFWPTGSGCARGFLGVLDTAWLIREYGLNQRGPLEMMADRESVYRLLAQVTKDNMHKAIAKYTVDPRTRYVIPDMSLEPNDVVDLVNSDNPRIVPICDPIPLNNSTSVHEISSPQVLEYAIWRFCQQMLSPYKLKLYDLDASWRDGRGLSGLVAKFRPELLDYFSMIAIEDAVERIQAVFVAVSTGMGIATPCEACDWAHLDKAYKVSYIGRIVGIIREDSDRLQKCVITPRALTQKRKVSNQPIMLPRRMTQPIEKLAQDLLGCSSFRNDCDAPMKRQDSRDVSDRHESRLERLTKQDSLPSEGATTPTRHGYKTITEQFYEDAKHYTKRPQVDRLNPELVNKVEKIVTGDLLKDKEKEMYAEKDRQSQKFAQKMDRNNLKAMEDRLMQTGMGLLYNKPENMTSKDEKIMRISAADARKEAEAGFTREAELERFKQYDDTIRKSEDVLKNRDLTGIDPFCKWRAPDAQQLNIPFADEKKTSPPTPPRKTVTVENQENGVVVRPIAPVQPKRHSVAVVDSTSYDSVNARKQNNCQLCEKVVYLAERMHVESMFIHKNCFRCAYCSQPLRLGEYGKDKDLEYHYPKKFFCNIHLRVPLREKISGIERNARRLERAASKDRPVEDPSPPILPATEPPLIEDPNVSRRATLSFFSPEQLCERTSQRMRDMTARSIISPISDLSSRDSHTPERAEFGSHIRKSSTASAVAVDQSKTTLGRCPSASDSEEEDAAPISRGSSEVSDENDNGAGSIKGGSEDDDESFSECDDGLAEEELAELETTVLQLADEQPEMPITDDQVRAVIENINRRRSNFGTPLSAFASKKTPECAALNETMFYTPEVSFRPSNREVVGRERARTIAAMPTEEDEVAVYGTPSMEDIRIQKTRELERLRSESRVRAKLKTDAELGLAAENSHIADRRSVPVLSMLTPLTSRAHTVSPPKDRTKPRASSLLDNMPSLRRDIPTALPTLPHSPLEIRTIEPLPVNNAITNKSPSPFKTTPSPTAGMGMLSKLFSPDLIRKKSSSVGPASPPVNAEKVHCESRKETNILGNAFRRLKLKRETTPQKEVPALPAASPRLPTNPQVAAVAPSPRISGGADLPTGQQISVNEKSLKAFHKKAEKIIRQRDEALPRTAQEIQRTIQENEVRLEQLKRDGLEHEKTLFNDPINRWELECWMALLREREILVAADQDSRRRLRKLELQVKYNQLNARLRSSEPDEMVESSVLSEMLSVVNEKNQIEKAIEDNMKVRVKKFANVEELLRAKHYDFRNFAPVFSV